MDKYGANLKQSKHTTNFSKKLKVPGTVTMFTKLLFKYEIMTKQIKLDSGQQQWVYCLPYSWREMESPYYLEPTV